MEHKADVAIVGGGIVGLAHAYMALRIGLKVVLFEKELFAIGASVRNFGLVWPIGQEPGIGLNQALSSRTHWLEVCRKAGIWCNQTGSLHLAYAQDEVDVLEEFVGLYEHDDYRCEIVDAASASALNPLIKKDKLKAALWSHTEMTVFARDAIRKIPSWLVEQFGLVRRFGHTVVDINLPFVRTSREIWKVDRVVVCSGSDFETLFPEVYKTEIFTKCKLQMMRIVLKNPITMGPAVCGGLTLRHYESFSKCKSLAALDQRIDRQNPKLKEHGVHILISQNQSNELIVGDSHHYFNTVEPFDSEEVNDIILQYFNDLIETRDYKIVERWHGVYPKFKNGLHFMVEPYPGVQIVNGLGGAGMTLSFGVAEEIVSRW